MRVVTMTKKGRHFLRKKYSVTPSVDRVTP